MAPRKYLACDTCGKSVRTGYVCENEHYCRGACARRLAVRNKPLKSVAFDKTSKCYVEGKTPSHNTLKKMIADYWRKEAECQQMAFLQLCGFLKYRLDPETRHTTEEWNLRLGCYPTIAKAMLEKIPFASHTRTVYYQKLQEMTNLDQDDGTAEEDMTFYDKVERAIRFAEGVADDE